MHPENIDYQFVIPSSSTCSTSFSLYLRAHARENSHKLKSLKEGSIPLSLGLNVQGISPRTAGHAIETHGPARMGERDKRAQRGLADTEVGTGHVSGFLARGDNGGAEGDAEEQLVKIGPFHYFQILVAGGVLRPHDGTGRIVEGDALSTKEVFYLLLAKTASLEVDEVISVMKEQKTKDTPHVIGKIGIEEIHAPAFACWRKTAQHEQACLRGQERLQWMALDVEGHGNELVMSN